jgi:heme/copper-type cytochrome/quinol oxidase subunit 3
MTAPLKEAGVIHRADDIAMGEPVGLSRGKLGIWWFLASEVMVFGGLIGSYVLARIAAGGWEEAVAHVNTRIGAINTLILVTSSLTVVEAFGAVERRDRARAAGFLLVTVLLGCAFLGIKAYEYTTEISHGFLPSSGPFWSFYYVMTGLHGLHVLAGIVVNAGLFGMAAGGQHWPAVSHRVELAGLYWHFVDVVWIFLFPLLYLA